VATTAQRDDYGRAARDLRLGIARSRRRIDARLHGSRREAERLLSWRTYFARYPLAFLAGAAGLGMIAAVGLKPGRLGRWFGAWLLRGAQRQVVERLGEELARWWTPGGGSEPAAGGAKATASEAAPASGGGRHG
jgi:hypothetical protein